MPTKTIIITAGIHGDEPEGLALAQRIRKLCEGDQRFVVVFHGMLNPHGFALGTRKDAEGIDLNRTWSAEGNRAGSIECNAAWRAIMDIRAEKGSRTPDDMLVIDCHSLDGTPGVFYAGELGQGVAEGCFGYVARIDAWETAGTLTSACEAVGVRAVAVEVSKGESNNSIAVAVAQAINTWAAFGPTGKSHS